jgi:hypothetical protein
MEEKNTGGNTPLHVAAAKNSKESVKWLLLRGASTEALNKNGKTPYEMGMTANCLNLCDIIMDFTPDSVGNWLFNKVPAPPRLIVDITEHDTVVQNVLSSLSSSIGKQFTPEVYYPKNKTPLLISPKKIECSDRNSVLVSPMEKSKSNRFSNSEYSLKKNEERPSTLKKLNFASSSNELELELDKSPSFSDLIDLQLNANKLLGSDGSQIMAPVGADFEQAWRKTHLGTATSDIPSVSKIKHYILEKLDNGNKEAAAIALVGIEKLESGYVAAVADLEKMQAENQMLLNRLKYLNQ